MFDALRLRHVSLATLRLGPREIRPAQQRGQPREHQTTFRMVLSKPSRIVGALARLAPERFVLLAHEGLEDRAPHKS